MLNEHFGGTQTLFRNSPKVSCFRLTQEPSDSGPKIVPAHKILVHQGTEAHPRVE